jgi:hypothetical protein
MTTEADDAPTAVEQLAMLLTEVRLDRDAREEIDQGKPVKHVYEEMLATIQGAIDEGVERALRRQSQADR